MRQLKPCFWVIWALMAAACTPKPTGDGVSQKLVTDASETLPEHHVKNSENTNVIQETTNIIDKNTDKNDKTIDNTTSEPVYDLTPKVLLDATSTAADALKLPQAWGYMDGVLRLKDTPEVKNSFWISDENMPPDGVLRAVLKMGKRPDSSVMYRASFPENPEAVDGYSVTFDHQYVQIHRWEGGFAAPVTAGVKVKKWPPRVEIVVTLRGAHADVAILDAETKTALAHLESDDAALRGHQTGYRIYRKQDKTTGLVHLSFEPAQTIAAAPKLGDPDAYIRQHPNMYVMVPEDKTQATPALAACTPLKHTDFIEGYEIFRCDNKAMMQLVSNDLERKLPEGFFWTEPRTSFTDSEFRKAARDLKCPVPMRCHPEAPIDPNRSAKDAAMTYAYLRAYAKTCKTRYAHVRLESIGQTYLGYDIKAIVLSNASPDIPTPRVLFNGAHHGMELLATDMAFDVLEQLCETPDETAQKRYASVLNHAEVWIIPTVNLDGNDMFMHVSNHLGRKNGRGVFQNNSSIPHQTYPVKAGPVDPSAGFYRYRPNAIAVGAGVDINRNYPLEWGATGEKSSSSRPRDYWYRGTAPASEPEVQTMMNLFHAQQFASSISFHTVSTKILSPYSIDALHNPPSDQDNAWQLALKMAEAAGEQASGKPYQVVKNLYSVDGTDQDWFRMISGTYAYLIEGALHNPTGEDRRNALRRNRPAWETFLDAVHSSTLVRVRDTEGNPLIAEVSYSDIPQLNQEHWLTRCQDGTHSLLCFGKRDITVTLMDGTTQTKSVQCKDHQPTFVDFTFQKPLQYSIERATIKSGVRLDLFGIDAICDMRNNRCPTLPAQRYCLIDNKCIPSGQYHTDDNGKKMQCQPGENNRNWTMIP